MSLLDKASLVVTPNAYKASKLYSVIPSSGAGDMDVVRATTATRVNSLGLIESVGVNIPRIDYTNGSCPSLLVEPQRTNLFTYSNDFSNVTWIKNSSTITANSIISPDGTTNASKLVEGTANDSHHIYKNVFSNGQNTFTFYAKQGERKFVYAYADNVGQGKCFDLENGTLGVNIIAAPLNSSITSVGNGWYRCSITISITTVTALRIGACSANGTFSYLGNGTSGIYIYGSQCEVGSYATSYIPTVASTVTRNADTISKTGISSLIGQTEGTVFVECYNQLIDSTIIYLNKNNSNSVVITSNAIGFSGRVFCNGIQYSAFSNSFIIKNQKIKIAFKYSPSGLKLFVNGSLNSTNINPILFTAPIDGIFLNDGSIINLNQTIYNNSVQLYKTALTDQECINLTTL
jgi:hypothetical protein